MEDFTNYHTQSKEKIKHDGIELFAMHLNDFEGVDGFIDTTPQKFLIQKHVSQANEFKDTCKVMCLSTITINRGSIVDDNIHKYLVTSDINDNTFYKDAELQQCTNTLKLYDKTSVLNDIISVPCVVSSSTITSLKIDNQDKFDLLEGKIVVQVPNNVSTSTIYEKQRFLLGQYAYEVTGIDDITSLGVLKISMSKVEKNDKDDFTNGIAWNDEIIKNNYKILVLNGTNISFNTSQSIILDTQVTNNGTKVSPTPELIFTSSVETICTVNDSGTLQGITEGNCMVTVALKSEPSISTVVNISVVSAQQDNFACNIIGADKIIKKKSAVFKCEFSNNGAPITRESIFELYDLDGITPLSSSIAYIVNQDSIANTCEVYGCNVSGIKYFNIVAKSSDGLIISDMLKVKIYSLV